MDFLIANLSQWDKRNTDHWFDVGFGYDTEYENRSKNKHYILNEYLVNDIINVTIANRGIHTQFRSTITINPDHDNARVIHAMNIAFELAAERFANDQNHGVYAYGRVND